MSQDHLQQQTTAAISAISTPQQQQQMQQQQNSHHHQQPQQQQQQQQQQYFSESSPSNNTTYRPRSPDLSAYIFPPHQQAVAYQQNQRNQPSLFDPSYQENHSGHFNHNNHNFLNTSSSWQRQGHSAALTGLPSGTGSYPAVTHRGSYDASPYFSPQGSLSLGQGEHQGGYFVGGGGGSGNIGGQQQGQQQDQQQGQRKETLGYGSVNPSAGDYSNANHSRLTYSPTAATSEERFGPGRGFSTQYQPSFAQTSIAGFSPAGQDQGSGQTPVSEHLSSSFSPQQHQHEGQQPRQRNMPPSRRKRGQASENDDSGDFDYTPEASAIGGGADGGKASRKRKSDHGHAWRAPGDLGPSMGIEVKTKFPVARIKRIMQADEDVGKVAQATPTAVSKALELFMITLVTNAATEAKDRSSKRVTAAHLKQAVIKDPTFDFLQEIIEKVADPTEKKGGRATSEDMDDGAGIEAGGGAPTKKKRAPRGKKKGDDDED